MPAKSTPKSPKSLPHKLILANIGLYDRMFHEAREAVGKARQRSADVFNWLVEEGEEIEMDVLHLLEENESFSFTEMNAVLMGRKLGKARDDLTHAVEGTIEGAGLTRRAIARTAKRVVHDIAGDDLTKIKGIGKKREAELHGEGIRTFEQLALMSAKEVRQLDEALNLGGRIKRQDWKKQAKALAQAAA